MCSQNSLPDYPKRPQFFASKLTKHLYESGALQEIGSLAAHLVLLIVHKEDSLRYRCPVRCFDSTLVESLSAKTQKELAIARNKAVAAGWLKYKHGTKGVAGVYFGTIPEHLTSEANNCYANEAGETGNKSGTETEQIRNESETDREQTENEKVTQRETYIPIPYPFPDPSPQKKEEDELFQQFREKDLGPAIERCDD